MANITNIDTSVRVTQQDHKLVSDLYNAMRGCGTDEDTVFHVLESTPPDQLARVKELWQTKHGKEWGSLQEAVSSEMDGDDYHRATRALDRADPDYGKKKSEVVTKEGKIETAQKIADTVENLHDAIDGGGTTETQIYYALENLTTKNELEEVRRLYKAKYEESLDDAIKGDMEGGELARAMREINRLEGKKFTKEEAKEVAESFYEAMDGAGTDEYSIHSALFSLQRFKSEEERNQAVALVICEYERSHGSIKKVENPEEYFLDPKNRTDSTLYKHFNEEMEGADLDRALDLLVGFDANRTAKSLLESFDGWLTGTDNTRVWTNIVGKTPEQMEAIRNAVLVNKELNPEGKDLMYWAKEDLSSFRATGDVGENCNANEEVTWFATFLYPDQDLQDANRIYLAFENVAEEDLILRSLKCPDGRPKSQEEVQCIIKQFEDIFGNSVYDNQRFNELIDRKMHSIPARNRVKEFADGTALEQWLVKNPQVAQEEQRKQEEYRRKQPDYIAKVNAETAITQWKSPLTLDVVNKLTYEEAYIASGNAWHGALGTAAHNDYQGQCFKYFVTRVNQIAKQENQAPLDISTPSGLEQAQQAYQQFKNIQNLNHKYYNLSGQSLLFLRESTTNVPTQELREINKTWDEAQRTLNTISSQSLGLNNSGRIDPVEAQKRLTHAQSLYDNWDESLCPKALIKEIALPQLLVAGGLSSNPRYRDPVERFIYITALLNHPDMKTLAPNFDFNLIDPRTPAGQERTVRIFAELQKLAQANNDAFNYTGQISGSTYRDNNGRPTLMDIRIDGDWDKGQNLYRQIPYYTLLNKINQSN